MNLQELMSTARDAVTVKRVYSEPIESDGVTVITAAAVSGGGGGGSGTSTEGEGGDGGGFGVGARPAGAYVIRGGEVSWRPAIDVNQLARSLSHVLVVYFVTRALVERKRAAASR